MSDFFRIKARRGYWVAASWLVWPVIGAVLDFGIHLAFSTTRGCSIEGCNYSPGALDLLLVFGPPICVTVWWWNGRQRRTDRE